MPFILERGTRGAGDMRNLHCLGRQEHDSFMQDLVIFQVVEKCRRHNIGGGAKHTAAPSTRWIGSYGKLTMMSSTLVVSALSFAISNVRPRFQVDSTV